MRGNFPPGACPDGPVNDWPTQMKKMPGHWEQLPNDGNVTAPGTVILTSQGTQKHGHVEIIDSKGQRTSASLGSRPGKATGPVIRGKPIKDQWKKRNGKVTLWRYKG